MALAEPAIAGDGGDQLASVHGVPRQKSLVTLMGPAYARGHVMSRMLSRDLLQPLADNTVRERDWQGVRAAAREPN
jgi:hypothetical protein